MATLAVKASSLKVILQDMKPVTIFSELKQKKLQQNTLIFQDQVADNN